MQEILSPTQIDLRKYNYESQILKLKQTNIPECVEAANTIEFLIQELENFQRSENCYYCQHTKHNTRNKIYDIDENYFENIDTEDKAYFLGFMYADGNVSKDPKYCIRINLQEKDRDILEKFKSCLQSTHPIVVMEKYGNFKTEQRGVKFYFGNKKIKSDLIKWGCVPNKTLKLTTLPNLDHKLLRHFIRGYFDGDGSLGLYQKPNSSSYYVAASICGNKTFTNNLDVYISQTINIKFNINERKSINVLQTGYNQALIFIDWLYKDCSIYLNRKYQTYLKIKEYYENIK